MNSMPRTFTTARTTALVLIALLAAALAYIRFEPDPVVSVPEGARAGQLTNVDSCEYDTEDGSYAADCGTLVVPENRGEPGSRLIAIPVTRIRARTHNPKEPIFRLEGGPGMSNMKFPMADRFADEHDVVLVGYRGVDGSSKLDCPEVTDVMRHSADLLEPEHARAVKKAYSECAARLQEEDFDLGGYTLPERVDDLEAARKALGYDRVNVISESAGTRTAMIWDWRYPDSINRSVLIAVNPPGHFVWDAATTDEQIRAYARLCERVESCNERTDDLAATVARGARRVPERWGFLRIKDGQARIASFYGLMHATEEGGGPLTASATFDSWLSAASGDPSGLWLQSLASDLVFPRTQVWGDIAAIGRTDAAAARRHFADNGRLGSILGDAGASFLWAEGALTNAFPATKDDSLYDRVRDSDTETLVVNGELDFATPAESATEELMPHLANGHEVILPEQGHSGDFWLSQEQAGTRLVSSFLATGKVDTSLFSDRKETFEPAAKQTFVAKIVAGSLAGLALLVLLSLVWLPMRVYKRGRLGRKAGALLRSLLAPLLALGGWSLAALVALTFTPTIPIDAELLVVVATALPAGLAVYWGWVDRGRDDHRRRMGLVAALGGALAGGWLGFHAIVGMLGLFTAIAGAVGGANLTLIARDIAHDRDRARQQTATSHVVEAWPTRTGTTYPTTSTTQPSTTT